MKRQTLIILSIPTLLILIAVSLILANEAGYIVGRIIDSQTQDPIEGATVLVVGTNRGAVTDSLGEFVIKGVPAGVYTLKITSIGYQSIEIKNVAVKDDATIEVNNALTVANEYLEDKVVVKAERDIINKFETSNQTIIEKEHVSHRPMPKVDQQDVQAPDAGESTDTKSRTKSGRAFEVDYMTDGVVPDASTCFTPPTTKAKKGIPKPVTCMPPYYGWEYLEEPRFDDMFFKNYGVNPFVNTADDYQSTFAIDVDDASYSLCRSYLNQSALPPIDAIRTEEFINHFEYDYTSPRNEPFCVNLEGAPSRFGEGSQLLKIGIMGKTIDEENRQPANLVLVVDVSGSMGRENRIVLVQNTLRLLIDQLYFNDRVVIVAYNQTAKLVLPSTPVKHKGEILAAIARLYPSGSTNCQEGLRLGFHMASRQFDPERTNRVFLFSDGVANVGNTSPEAMINEIKRFTDMGITLSTIGVGMGNYNDILMEKLGDKGNGFYAYVDDIEEAKSVFKKNLNSALQVIARDVKIQVEFDPEVVSSYRLLGYENRNVADYQFRNDRADGGEIGPGHTVTTLYEVNLNSTPQQWYYGSPRSQEIKNVGRIFIRYINPETGNVEETSGDIPFKTFKSRFSKSSSDFKLAVTAAEFAEIMRDSYWSKNSSLNDVLQLANEVYRQTSDENVLELVNLIGTAKQLRGNESEIFSNED